MYRFSCEQCGGKVLERQVAREVFRHKSRFVALENVPIGICSQCGARYFDAAVLRRVAEIGRLPHSRTRRLEIPLARF